MRGGINLTAFLLIRIFVIPVVVIFICRKCLKSVLLNILLMPILWIVFYFFYFESVITWLASLIGLMYCSFTRNLLDFESSYDSICYRITNKINCFELITTYLPSVVFSTSLFYSGMDLYFLGWHLI